jgi:hypothetical protein
MSTNVKYLNQKDAGSSKNCLQKKFGLNSKAIPSKSFRNKNDKSKNSKQPLGVINENDINQANVKSKKEPQIKKTKTLVNKNVVNPNSTNGHFHRLSSFNMDNDSTNSINSSPKASNSTSLNLENLLLNINLSKKNKIDTDDYREMFSKYVRDDYSNSILQCLLEDEQVNENFLNSHKITERMRTRMVDWMIEVLSNYHCDESTYFEAINLMDRYFKQCDIRHQILQPPELHLIGVTSMFIASKYQDIYPLRLKIVKDKIAHNKLSCQEIKDKEDEITRYLDYNLGLPTMWDFINLYLEEIFYINCNKHHIKNQILLDTYYKNIMTEEDEALANVINKKYTKNMLNLLKYVCVYLAKMNCHDYQLMQKKHSLLAASTIFVAIKICEQINKEEYINDYFTEKLNEISNNSENDIIKTAQKILYNAQNFDTKFNGLENLKKVHFNAIIELKETK